MLQLQTTIHNKDALRQLPSTTKTHNDYFKTMLQLQTTIHNKDALRQLPSTTNKHYDYFRAQQTNIMTTSEHSKDTL